MNATQWRNSTRSTKSPTAAVPGGRPAPLRHHVLRRQRVDGPQRRRPDHQRARRVAGAGPARGALPRPAGRARFELDGERVDAPAGTFVFVRPDVKRTAFAEEPGTTLVALGGTPGKAYEPTAGRSGRRCTSSTRRASTPRPPTAGRELIEAHPEYAGPLYNLACCESLAGRPADAIEHLRLAIERYGGLPLARRRATPTSIRSAKSPGSRSYSPSSKRRSSARRSRLRSWLSPRETRSSRSSTSGARSSGLNGFVT